MHHGQSRGSQNTKTNGNRGYINFAEIGEICNTQWLWGMDTPVCVVWSCALMGFRRRAMLNRPFIIMLYNVHKKIEEKYKRDDQEPEKFKRFLRVMIS